MLVKIKLTSEYISKADVEKLENITGEALANKSDNLVLRNKETGYYSTHYSWYDKEYDKDKYDLAEEMIALSNLTSGGSNLVVDMYELTEILPHLTFEVIKTYRGGGIDATNAINKATEKLTSALKSFDERIEFNQKCEVHVANLGLLHINDLMLKEDCCSDVLQEQLNDGWRIISVCPQPDQRRPDYILGRYNPDLSVTNTRDRASR